MMRYVYLTMAVVIFCMVPLGIAQGHDDSDGNDSVAVIQAVAAETATAASAEATLAGHNAWMMVCCALVLFMTAPGLALFYCGLVRRKNVLSLMMQCLFLMGLMTIVWSLWGYSLCFGGTPGEEGYSRWIGNGQFLMMTEVQGTWDAEAQATVYPMEGKIPRLTHMLFQGMFFIITPALICGAFAERMKFSTLVVFMVLWNTLVYCPLCHWMWDGGVFAEWGGLDFAGGAVVHISSGVAALLCAILVGRRLGLESEGIPPHNLTYTATGTAMLWFGWFGFNAGSGLASDGLAASAFAATHFSAAAGALTWPTIEWIRRRGKPSVLGTCSGAIAGLACITPAVGYVTPMSAILIGILASICCYYACTALKTKFGYDDSLDVFGIHGVGGTLGILLTGVFATRAVQDINKDGAPLGLIDGGGFDLLKTQAAVVVATYLFTLVVTLLLLKVLDSTMGLRVTQEEEILGIDLSQHGEEGYISV
ncbi:MAG: ammonium transporter [Planctomycetota bacterium]|nr:ammonium transporter [Planctomycetota bacterium]